MSESTQLVQLTFTGACVTAKYGGGQRQQVPQRCVQRSTLLSDLSASEHSGAETPAPCPEEGFKGWMDLVSGNRSRARSLTAQELVSALKASGCLEFPSVAELRSCQNSQDRIRKASQQGLAANAADVLIDEKGILYACAILSDRYLAPFKGVPARPFQQAGSASQPGCTDSETRSQNAVKVCFRTVCGQQVLCDTAQQILDCLPQHLHPAVLRATCDVLDVPDVISLVPPSAAPLALRTCCPSIDSSSSLELRCESFERCSSFRKALHAASTCTHLQHLCINFKVDAAELQRCSDGYVMQSIRTCIRQAIDTIHCLTTLRSLELLYFRADGSMADAFAQSISSATALTSLCLVACEFPDAELQCPFAECLLPLTRLQRLTLNGSPIITRMPLDTTGIHNDVEEGQGEGGSHVDHQETASEVSSKEGQDEDGSEIGHQETASMAASEEEESETSLMPPDEEGQDEGGSETETQDTASMASSEPETSLLPLGEVVQALSSLTELTLSSSTLDWMSEEFNALAHRGTLLSRIQVLRMEGIGGAMVRRDDDIHQLLVCMPRLQELHLAYSEFDNLTGVDFSASPDLRLLDLRCNGLGGWYAQGTSSLGRLSALYLGGNNMVSWGVEILASHFSALASLQILSFSEEDGRLLRRGGNYLADSGAAVLAQHLSALVCLTELDLRGCEIKDAGICDLASALRSAPCLRALNVENNPVGVAGLEGLAQGLRRCTTLCSLALGWCYGVRCDDVVPGPDVATLAEVLGACMRLTQIRLGPIRNMPEEEVRPVLFSALGDLTALRSLNITSVGCSIVGLAELTRMVGLEQLCVRYMWVRSDVPCEKSGGKDWEQVLAACVRLTRLEFDSVLCTCDDADSEADRPNLQIAPGSLPENSTIARMVQAISRAQSLREVVLRDALPPDASKICMWQESFARVLPQMQSLTKLRFSVLDKDLQPCVKRAAAVASVRRGETVTVEGITRGSD